MHLQIVAIQLMHCGPLTDHNKHKTITNSTELERALGRVHTFAYHKIGHCIMNILALVACQLDKN